MSEQLDVGSDVDSPARGRVLLTAWLRQAGWDEWSITRAATVLTEMIANAVVHAGSLVKLELRLSGDLLRVDATDSSTSPPIRRRAERWATSGRGVAMIASLSDRWGVSYDVEGRGKRVWFEMQRRHDGATEAGPSLL